MATHATKTPLLYRQKKSCKVLFFFFFFWEGGGADLLFTQRLVNVDSCNELTTNFLYLRLKDGRTARLCYFVGLIIQSLMYLWLTRNSKRENQKLKQNFWLPWWKSSESSTDMYSIDRVFFREKKSETSAKSTIFECLVFRIIFRSFFFSRKHGFKI